MKKQKERTRSVCGVGINDAGYKISRYEKIDGVSKRVWICPFYQRWKGMLVRAYDQRYHKKYPTYKSCTVCKEWLVFTNFKRWMENQNWECKVLDKDLLKFGNKEYHPDGCAFIHGVVNRFIVDTAKERKDALIGAQFNHRRNKFEARCRNPFTGKKENLGHFDNPEDAHLAWKVRKHELASQLADSEYVDDERVAEALRTRYL